MYPQPPIAGFVQVMENLESHRMIEFHFPCLESHVILVWVMEIGTDK